MLDTHIVHILFFVGWFFGFLPKVVSFGVDYCAEHVFTKFAVVLFKVFKYFFYVFSSSVFIGGAGVVNYGFALCKADNFHFTKINHRPNNRDFFSGKPSYGGKSRKSCLVEKREEKCFDKVVGVMT